MLSAMQDASANRSRCLISMGVIDTCGTGGGSAVTRSNVSTIAAFVVAGAGAKVCKHGNRAASSRVADRPTWLEGLGVAIELAPEAVARCVAEAGIGFSGFAKTFHPAMRHAGPDTPQSSGVPTVFNFPRPARQPGARVRRSGVGRQRQAHGREDGRRASRRAAAERAPSFVFSGTDGLDELTTTTDVDGGRGCATTASYDAMNSTPAAYGIFAAEPSAVARRRLSSPTSPATREGCWRGHGPVPIREPIVVLNAARPG